VRNKNKAVSLPFVGLARVVNFGKYSRPRGEAWRALASGCFGDDPYQYRGNQDACSARPVQDVDDVFRAFVVFQNHFSTFISHFIATSLL